MQIYNKVNPVTITQTNIINEVPCGCGTLRTTAVRKWHQVCSRDCAEVSAALAVSCRPVLRSQLLSKSPADLH